MGKCLMDKSKLVLALDIRPRRTQDLSQKMSNGERIMKYK